jgi:hypothetical protein
VVVYRVDVPTAASVTISGMRSRWYSLLTSLCSVFVLTVFRNLGNGWNGERIQ